jgi:uncharacterized protein (TIGR02246 family)
MLPQEGSVVERLLQVRVNQAAVAIAAAALFVSFALGADAQAPPPTASSGFDEPGVRAAVSKRIDAERRLDAHLVAELFADDAIWVNAFGRRIVGRPAIATWFAELYDDPGYKGRQETVAPAIAEVVFVRPDVAVVRILRQNLGQRLPNGTTIERRTHNTMTQTREPDGWKVRYEVVTDERDRSAQQ